MRNILSIGGGFFAALLGITGPCQRRKGKNAEFLLTHPIQRRTVIFQKLLAVIFQLIIMNLLVMAVSAASLRPHRRRTGCQRISGCSMPLTPFCSLKLPVSALAFPPFCVTAGVGAGLGLAALLYFFNIFKNISRQAAFLKYITPFAYAEAADIIADSAIDMKLLALGILYTVIGIAAAFAKYTKKRYCGMRLKCNST